MPAVPIIRQCCGEIRLAEVLDHVNSEDLRNGAGYINSAGKVRINLQRIKQHRKAQGRPGERFRGLRNRPDRRGSVIRNHQFFEQAPQRELQAVFDAGKVGMVLFQKLTRQLVIPADRPLQELRKETDEERILSEIPFCPDVSAADINDIAHCLEGVERDPQRQDDSEGQVRKSEQISGCSQKRRDIFQEEQNTEIQHKDQGQHPMRFPARDLFLRLLLFSVPGLFVRFQLRF